MSFHPLTWCREQDPENVPFRPGAKHTQGFGLRISMIPVKMGASPGHIGNDRGAQPVDMYMPFKRGAEVWKKTGGAAGSLLQLIPSDGNTIEMQIFHTIRRDKKIEPLRAVKDRGERLSVNASSLGLSVGVHTHSEIITPALPEFVEDMKYRHDAWIFTSGKFNEKYIRKHCDEYGMAFEAVFEKLKQQVIDWEIEELWEVWAVRRDLPNYRTPHWGKGPTLHLSTKEFLQI
jgi:hypothetical protein